jgi:hypothetical protein
MPGQFDAQIRHTSVNAAREIKAHPVYQYVTNGITLDGSKFAPGELVVEGTCLVMDNTTKKYEKYVETTAGTFEPGKSNPVILDTAVKFELKDDGTNADKVVGAALVAGAVWKGMLKNYTDAFGAKCPTIRVLVE